MSFRSFLLFGILFLCGEQRRLLSAEGPAKVYVVLWFDTEDYILPASDDAALRLAKDSSQKEN